MHYFGTDHSSVITENKIVATRVVLTWILLIAAVKEASPFNPAAAESDIYIKTAVDESLILIYMFISRKLSKWKLCKTNRHSEAPKATNKQKTVARIELSSI